MKTITTLLSEIDLRDDDNYEGFLSDIRNNFNQLVGEGNTPLFTTNINNLYEIFLSGLPEEAKQHYNCRCCRRFVDRFGGIVTITEVGRIIPVMWTKNVPVFFKEAVNRVYRAVARAKVTGVFFSDTAELGAFETGSWKHIAVRVPAKMVHNSKIETAQQRAAMKDEEHRLLCEAMNHYSKNTIEQAVNLLRSDDLYRSEKVLGCAEWLMRIRREIDATNTQHRSNLLWRYAATAPVGYCHVRSGMIGTLLDDIAAGMSLAAVKARFADKMNPVKYQRPTAAPSATNVRLAEKLIEDLGLTESLKRRFARLEELNTVWLPAKRNAEPRRNGVFASVVTKEECAPAVSDALTPGITMTWEKFLRKVLPNAIKVEYYVESKNQSFAAILTAADETAPPIIQWDNDEQRNPFSWYLYNNGSAPRHWGLENGFCEVTGIAYQPNMWNGGFEHQGEGIMFVLKGAKDQKHNGIALFPEILKSELHKVRPTIEAFSKDAQLSGYDEASACGLLLQNGHAWNARFRVTSDVGTTIYTLDRWD